MSDNLTEKLPVAAPRGNAPKPKFRGKGSSNKRHDNFVISKNDAVCRERRSALERELQPNLVSAFRTYQQQVQSGTSVKKVVPITTRGIGFHTLNFFKEANLNVPRIDLPLRATVHELYRVSLVQLARQVLLAEVGPTHSQALRLEPKARISPFSFHRNSIFVCDAISSVGNFTFNSVDHISVIPEHFITQDTFVEELPVVYNVQSPVAGGSQDKQQTQDQMQTQTSSPMKRVRREFSIPDPYFITIYNLWDAVKALSDPQVPIELRNRFINRNPIPGAVFQDGLLTNPDDVMQYRTNDYLRIHFPGEVSKCEALINQVAPICPGSIGSVAMDGKGNELSLCTVRTPPSAFFGMNSFNVICEGESWMFATQPLSDVTRLRSYTSLMNEAPLHVNNQLTSLYGMRDPNNACHTMNEVWSNLAWNVSPFQTHHG